MPTKTPPQAGDRVIYAEKNPATTGGWPHGRAGVLLDTPWTGVWYLRVDDHPHSLVGVTEKMVVPET